MSIAVLLLRINYIKADIKINKPKNQTKVIINYACINENALIQLWSDLCENSRIYRL